MFLASYGCAITPLYPLPYLGNIPKKRMNELMISHNFNIPVYEGYDF